MPNDNILSARHGLLRKKRVTMVDYNAKGKACVAMPDGHVETVTPKVGTDADYYDPMRP